MGFFSPGFMIGAASSLTNQIEDAKERNAEMMERRRDQFDQLSREAKRELNRKKMTEQEYVDLAKEVLSPELQIQIGDDSALLAAAGKSFKTQSQVRGLTPSNFNKSLLLSGMTEEGKFDPTKAFNIIEPPKMDVETQTEEGFFGRAFRGITGAPSQQELAETDPSRLTTDIRGASVNLNKIYNPLDFDDSAWNKAYNELAKSKGINLSMKSAYEYDLDPLLNSAKDEKEIKAKLNIINALRNNQAYTEDDIGGIIGHVDEIYKKVENSGDQFNTIVTQIAKDMNETSVSDVLNNLEKYKTVNKTPPETLGTPGTVNQPPTGAVPDQIDEAVNQPVPGDLLAKLQAKLKNPSWRQDNSDRDKNGRIIYTFEDGGKVYRISNDENNTPIILSVTPISEQ
jgi:hypothetical protein